MLSKVDQPCTVDTDSNYSNLLCRVPATF